MVNGESGALKGEKEAEALLISLQEPITCHFRIWEMTGDSQEFTCTTW
jgi:hypothetical protein